MYLVVPGELEAFGFCLSSAFGRSGVSSSSVIASPDHNATCDADEDGSVRGRTSNHQFNQHNDEDDSWIDVEADAQATMASVNGHFSSAGDMKSHLQSLLDSKEHQLQQAATFGQRVLAQRMELEERIRQLQEVEVDKSEDDEIDQDSLDKYKELAETVMSWDNENAELSSTFSSSKVRMKSVYSAFLCSFIPCSAS